MCKSDFAETRLIASVQPQRIKKSYEDFVKVSDEILKLNETVRAEFVKIMENWEPNPMAKLPPFDQFRFESNTAYFRAVSRDNLRQYQSEGVEKVQIVAYIDDRTSPTCLDMHGRVFNISGYEDKLGQNTSTPNPDEMLGYAGRPTTDITTILPPYHFNCRTTFVAYEEPKNELDKVKEDIYNCEKISKEQAQSMLNKAVKANWGSQKNLKKHYSKHGKDKQISLDEYNQAISDNIRRAGRHIIFGINKESFNLHAYFIRKNIGNSKKPHLLSIIDLSNNKIVSSFYCNDRYLNSTIEKKLIKSSKNKQWSNIMKQKEMPYFKGAEAFEKSEIPQYVDLYVKYFFSLIDLPGNEDLDVWYDTENRYSLYLSEQQGLLTDEQKEQVHKADKIYYDKYLKNKFRTGISRVNDDIADFFEWLGEVIER